MIAQTSQAASSILNYVLTEQLYAGERTVVYRAVEQEHPEQYVVLKVQQQPHPSFDELVQFRNQYTIAKNLAIPGIVQPIVLKPWNNGYVLVMADCGSVSLGEYLHRQPLDIAEVLTIGIQLATILHDLGDQRVIHKDIKPSNILIHPTTKAINLIDFSIASLLPKETQTIQTPNALEGTLAYIAPEQTGRMNRGIDYRTDFYGLGVTLYEVLTGELPFVSDDVLKLVHCHIAEVPVPPHQVVPHIPEALSAIVLKLMAKNAEDRYQSALGLKYDLEHCLAQWQGTGAIASFPLGERDVSDRFNIPETLYGRETEVQALLDAFERVANGCSEMMLVAGFSGIGKTAVVNEVHKPIVRQRGYFIKGKFDQFNRNIPFSAFVQAFRDLMGQLLGESDAQLQQWRGKILEAVGENGQVLIEVIPELEHIIGKQPPVPELSGAATKNRFNLLFEKFITVFTTKQHPLTLFLDDLQWADSASLNLLNVLTGDNQTGYLLLLGAYRDNEVFAAHPLMLCLGELEKQNVRMATLTLSPLSVVHLNQLVADTLSCTTALATPLTDLVYQKTKGNPFFTTQFLKGLHEDGLIPFNQTVGYWECDLVKVQEAALTNDVVEFMTGRLHKLPDPTQNVLKLAACIGNQFDLATLATICEVPLEEVAADLWSALREGLILPQSEAYKFFQGGETHEKKVEGLAVGYRFLHDRVQQAAYSLIPESQKNTTHYQIGKLLLHHISPDKWEENIFEIVNHLNQGSGLITVPEERHQLSNLNLIAGQRALASTAYESATQYFDSGIEFLDIDHWKTQYHTTLSLYQSAIKAEYLNINFTRAHSLANRALAEVTDVLDRVKIYELKIQMHMAAGEMPKSLMVGQAALELLDVELLEAPETSDIQLPELDAIASVPQMEDAHQIAVMRILIAILAPAYTMQPDLLPPILLTAIDRSLRYGHISLTAQAYVWYGLFLCSSWKDLEKGYYSGLLALKVLEQFPDQELECCVNNLFNVFIRPWKEPLVNSINPLEKARRIGFETGDIEYASYATTHRCTYLFLSGENLNEVQEQQNFALEILNRVKQEHSLGHGRIWAQLVSNLLQDVANPKILSGSYFDEAELLPGFCSGNDRSLPFTAYLATCMLNYLFEDYSAAVTAAINAEADSNVALGITAVTYALYYSLALLADYSHETVSNNESISTMNNELQSLLEQVEIHQQSMKKWVILAPGNCEHKFDLIEAEKCRVLGQKIEAIELYDRAISGAKENGYIQEEALANERFAKFYLDWGRAKEAGIYMQEAYYCYARWGAKAKIADLETCYPHLLAPILKQQQASLSASTLATAMQGTLSKTTTGTGAMLDLATLMKASRTLSETIELDGAIANLMHIARENAGAQTIALMLFDTGELKLVAKVTGEDMAIINPLPVKNSDAVPLMMVNHVKRSQQPVVLENATVETAWAGDSYIQTHQPLSILCLPLVDRGQLIGILYLENNQTVGAFSRDRVEILTLLCSQAAITLENAQLYQQAQQALTDLQQAQLQLVQSEKMSALGNLVAGVAHEINNPVGCILGNVGATQEYIKDLLGLLDLYGDQFPNPGADIEAELDVVELDYVRDDLAKLIRAMKDSGDRIKSISRSLRTFSRADTDTKQVFNLHDGLDSTVLILRHRLKANEQRPAIEVIKDYGDIPPIACFAGQLNQVFMNILANAIDALDEASQQRSVEDLKANPHRITIRTTLDNNQVAIAISDNGPGIPEKTQAKIFDYLFTTKAVGKGTGLGLAIAHQIVTETHGGRLEVESVVGQGTKFCIQLPL